MEKPLQVFCCYAREDQSILLQLKDHLSPLERDKLIIVQADINVSPGGEWEKQISHYLDTAQIILLLVSARFIASNYCYGKEMKRAIERHESGQARVIPIILRPVDWQKAPFGKLQALPANARPIAKWRNRDEAFLAIAEGIRKVVEELMGKSAEGSLVNVYQNTPGYSVDFLVISEAKRLLETLPLDHVPDVSRIPPHSRITIAPNLFFVGREADFRWLAAAFKKRATNTSGPIPTVVVSGLGGIGKTQLASEFVHRYGQYFSGGIFWISFANPENICQEIAACSTVLQAEPRLSIEEQAKYVLGVWQSELPRLLVFDNCEDEQLLDRWRPPTGGCRILLTSRRVEWSPNLGVEELTLTSFHRNESIALLSKYRPDLTHEDAKAIADEVGNLPLALHLAGSFLHTYRATSLGVPTEYLKELKKAPLQYLQGRGALPSVTHHEQNIERTFALSYNHLNKNEPRDQEALHTLARAAYLAFGEIIPRSLFYATPQQEEIDQERELRIEDAFRRLSELGLLIRIPKNSTNAPLSSTLLVEAEDLGLIDTNKPQHTRWEVLKQQDGEYFFLHPLLAEFVTTKIPVEEALGSPDGGVAVYVDTLDAYTSQVEALMSKGDLTLRESRTLQWLMLKRSELGVLISQIFSATHESRKHHIQSIRN